MVELFMSCCLDKIHNIYTYIHIYIYTVNTSRRSVLSKFAGGQIFTHFRVSPVLNCVGRVSFLSWKKTD